ncbi:MAG: hypothetical protein H0X38_05145 [Planctomycetes bacterium]|nr:hypothetical protein [Planctomycetota bacterium]
MDLLVPATVGGTIFRVDLGMGLIERIEARDYLIAADALGPFGLPLRGDRISEDLLGLGQGPGQSAVIRHTAEVLAPGREPHWRWVDATRLAYRIHTKHLSTEPIP